MVEKNYQLLHLMRNGKNKRIFLSLEIPFISSIIINFLLFLFAAHFTFIKSIHPQKVYVVDLYHIPQKPNIKKEFKQHLVKQIQPQNVENINPTSLLEEPSTENVETIEPHEQEVQSSNEPSIYEINELDSIPQILIMVQPIYPEKLRQKNKEGRVILKFLVNYYGYVEDIKVIESSGEILFDESAITAVKKWKFSIPTIKGNPCNVWLILPIKFELEE